MLNSRGLPLPPLATAATAAPLPEPPGVDGAGATSVRRPRTVASSSRLSPLSEEIVRHEPADRVGVLAVASPRPAAAAAAAAEVRRPVVPPEAEAAEIVVDLATHVVEQALAAVAETAVVVEYRQPVSVGHRAAASHGPAIHSRCALTRCSPVAVVHDIWTSPARPCLQSNQATVAIVYRFGAAPTPRCQIRDAPY